MKRLTDTKQKKLKLSTLLQSCSSEDKISLANRQISIINQVPQRFQSIKVMYLSQNFVSDISNITQFPQLKVLSLSYNQIKSFQSIQSLESLVHLQVLNLIGNPISKNILYNCLTIGACNVSLQKFDSNQVNENNVMKFKQKRRIINQKFCQLHDNYSTIIQLYTSLGSNYQAKSVEVVWSFLYNDCLEIFNSNKQKIEDKQMMFLEAMKDLQIKQLEKIQQLSESIRQSQQKLFQQNQEEGYCQEVLQSQHQAICKIVDIMNTRTINSFKAIKQFSTLMKIKYSNVKSSIQKSRLSSLTSHIQKYVVQQGQSHEERMIENIIRKKRQQRAIKKKYMQILKSKYSVYLIQKQTEFVCNKMNEFKERQIKYLQKIELLEELVEINKMKRKSLSNFETKNTDRELDKENTPLRMNSSRIVKQKSVMKLTEEKYNSLIKKRLGERSS